ncbi:MAG: hypothetical protein JNK58_13265, partial [Phycisphaerae bacterium]|nr:hypothetical protein [Phycisphaerae bacterium]
MISRFPPTRRSMEAASMLGMNLDATMDEWAGLNRAAAVLISSWDVPWVAGACVAVTGPSGAG